MGLITGLANGLGAVNALLSAIGLRLGATAMGLMAVIILLQVFFRYALGSALAWPEEASRFLMLWSTGLMAPTAFRRGGFVAIDMVTRLLNETVATALYVVLLVFAILVLWIGLNLSWSEVTGIGGRFQTDSLNIPTSFDFSTFFKVPKAWMMASLLVGIAMLFLVAIELFLRNLATLLGGKDALVEIPGTVQLGAE